MSFIKVLLMFCLVCNQQLLAEGQRVTPALVSANNAFALDLYSQLRARPGNFFFSPYSVSSALALTYAGANGKTAIQMAKALHFDLTPNQFHPAFARLEAEFAAIQRKGTVKLSNANSIWPQMKFPLMVDYIELSKKYYCATITPLDYVGVGAAESACKTINSWVGFQTKRMITDIITPDMLSAETRLVIVNALYFKGDWAYPFYPQNTRTLPFHINSHSSVMSKLMHGQQSFGYAECEDFQLLELPYAGHDLSMIVLLPYYPGGINHLEERFTTKNLEAWLGKLQLQEVKVILPKFKVSSLFDLTKPLVELGMTDAFDSSRANFSTMDGHHDIFISAVMHMALTEIDEKGTEAAAATGLMVTAACLQANDRNQKVPEFRADHPFLFFIRNTHNGSIIFLGRFSTPAIQHK